MKEIVKSGMFNGFTLKGSNPRPFGLFWGIILVISMILGCSTIKGDMLDEMEEQNPDQSNSQGADDLYNAARIVQSVDHMTGCTTKTQGYLYYIIDLNEFQYCDGTEYVTINLTGAQGPAGADGTDGVDGADGTDGTDGISIAWQGSLATAPADPQTNWAYYNSADGKSYIWDGDSWEILAQNGADGADGADGTDGTDGQDWTDVTDTVVDNGDGTVTDYSRTLVWKKCSQGQVWNTTNNDCTGTGSVDDEYGVGTYQYCDANDNSCNGGTDNGILDGGGASTAWSTCDAETLTGRNWRVPTFDELKDLHDNAYSNNISLFPNTATLWYYWSATSYGTTVALSVHFGNSDLASSPETSSNYVRCVSTGL